MTLSLFAFDAAATHAVNAVAGQSHLLDLAMEAVSAYGVPIMVLAVALQWWVCADRHRDRHVLVATGLSFLIGLGLNQLILLFVSRIRPYDAGITHLIIDRSVDFSFPSDHATATFAVAAAFLMHGMSKRGVAFLFMAALISFSRVFVGIHYASDIVGGAMTGIAAAIGVRWAYREGTRLDRLVTSIL